MKGLLAATLGHAEAALIPNDRGAQINLQLCTLAEHQRVHADGAPYMLITSFGSAVPAFTSSLREIMRTFWR